MTNYEKYSKAAEILHNKVIQDAGSPWESESVEDSSERVERILKRASVLMPPADRNEISRLVRERSIGLGAIERLLTDSEITEILISGTQPIWIERSGQLEQVDISFDSEEHLMHAIDRVLSGAGRRVDRAQPLCDAYLADGSRVHVALPPVAVDGPSVSIRRFPNNRLKLPDLVANGSLELAAVQILQSVIEQQRTVLFSGGTSSGKTTLLSAVAETLDPNLRLLLVEDTPEIELSSENVVRLQTRRSESKGQADVDIRELVRNALRMRPDRIIVGEIRGAEALDMVMAMSSGHEGSLSTIHSRSAESALKRLETLCLFAQSGLSNSAVSRLIADAVDVVVQLDRASSGRRLVTQIGQVTRLEDGWGFELLYVRKGVD